MKLLFTLSISSLLLILSACNVEPEIICPNEEFNSISNRFNIVISMPGIHQMVDSDGTVFNFNKQIERETIRNFDEETGCFIGFDEQYSMKYFQENAKVAEVEVKNTGSFHLLSLMVSSMAQSNNTTNLFEVEMDWNVNVIDPDANQELSILTDYLHNGILYPYLLKWERDPLLPNSDLVEIVSLIFSIDQGILYIELENGRYLNFHQ